MPGRQIGGVGAEAAGGPLAMVVFAMEQAQVRTGAESVRAAGEDTTRAAADLVAALEEASAAAAGVQVGGGGGLLTGPALAECAALLARRATELAADTDHTAGAMTRAASALAAADEEVARDVGGAAG